MRDIHAEITNAILADMEKGVLPWNGVGGGGLGLPMNAATGKAYRGINILQLWGAGAKLATGDLRFLTFKQALDLGGNVIKGSTGFKVCFYKSLDIQSRDNPEETRSIPMLKEFTVFHVSQVENCKGLKGAGDLPVQALPDDTAELIQALGASVNHGGDRAFYQPTSDKMAMPWPQDFTDLNGYRATLYHELTHWTGHKARLDRNLRNQFGSPEYAREELVAELGGAFLCAEFGLPYQTQHASYLANWLQVLKADKRAILQAASAAQKAVDFIRAAVLQPGDGAVLPVPVADVVPLAPALPASLPTMPGQALAPAGAARALVDRKAFLGAVAVAASVAPAKSTLVMLNAVRIQASGNALLLQATDLDVFSYETVAATCHGAFDVAVPVKALCNLLRKSDALDVGLVARDGGLMVCMPTGNVLLPGHDVADWPDLEAIETKLPHRLQLDIAALLQGLGVVAHAMSTEDTRYYLNGVYMHASFEGLRLVATDGHRLAMRALKVEGQEGFPAAIVPAVTVKLLARAWGRSPQGQATVKTGARWIEVEHGNLRLLSKLVDGTFPDYARVTPQRPVHHMAVDGLALKQAIAQVMIVAETKAKGVKLTFSEGLLQLQCTNADGAIATAEMPCTSRFADGLTRLECGVNSAYLADICTQAGNGLELGFVDGASPILCKATAGEGLLLLMPMRV
jgi:DNA polymerase III beta subunit